MKVALELQPCCWTRSGIGTYTYELASRLKNVNNVEFEGNLFNFMGRRDNAAALAGIEMPIRISKLFPYSIYRRLWHVLPIKYNDFFPKADLTVFFNFIVPPKIDGKVITYIHDLTYLRYPETMKQTNLDRLVKDISYSIERSDLILTVSEFTKKEMVELLGVPKERIDIANCAPAVSYSCANFQEVATRFGIKGKYILFVGTIEPRKNISRLVTAFGILKEKYNIPHQLVLAGGKGWQDEGIYEKLEQCKHRNEIILTGFVSNEEKNSLYKNAEAFVFPSLYEGFGIPPLEAMCWDCPVVVANAASLPEVVGDGAELVNPFDEEDIAEGIYRVISDEIYAKHLAEKGRSRVEKYTWERTKEQFVNACMKTLKTDDRIIL